MGEEQTPAPETKSAEDTQTVTKKPNLVGSLTSSHVLRNRVFLTVLVLVAALIGWYLVVNRPTSKSTKEHSYAPNVLAVVGNHEITSEEVQSYLSADVAVDDEEVINALMDVRLYEDVASNLKISVDESRVAELKKQFIAANQDYEKSKYVDLLARRDAIEQQIHFASFGRATGQYVIASFNQHLPFEGREDTTNPPAGRDQRIANDRTYATKFITQIKSDLESHKITFDQAIAREHADPYLGENALQTSLHSGSFDTGDSTLTSTGLFKQADITKVLSLQKAGSITEPFVVQVDVSGGESPKKAEGLWLLLKIDSKQGSTTQKSFDQLVSDQKAHGYKRLLQ